MSARLAILILSFNRRDALRRTLAALAPTHPRVLVADNASTDATSAMVRAEFPGVEVLALPENIGVAAFNRAADRASQGAAAGADADLLLILDDDAIPDPAGLDAALDHLARTPDCAAVALHPVHPHTRVSEWRHLRAPHPRWPAMGCGNLVRADAWRRVAGYEERFFLYRNDTDLAMKLLAVGLGVHADPAWIVWHDSPAAAAKSPRWLELATRNWLWLCRRHARGFAKFRAAALGAAWAARLAGVSPSRLARVARGIITGCFHAAPPLPRDVHPDGTALRELLRLQLASRRLPAPPLIRAEPPGSAPATTDQPAHEPAANSESMYRHSA